MSPRPGRSGLGALLGLGVCASLLLVTSAVCLGSLDRAGRQPLTSGGGNGFYPSVTETLPEEDLTTLFFTETGLRAGTNWSVILGGQNLTGDGSEVAFFEPKGTYAFRISSPGYTATPASGSISVSGKGEANESVVFTIDWAGPYSASFSRFGLPNGSNWSVVLAGTRVSSNRSSIEFGDLSPGRYAFSIAPVAGYVPLPARGNITITALNVSRSIEFEPIPPGPAHFGPLPLTPEWEFALFAIGAWCAWLSYTVVIDADYFRAAASDQGLGLRTSRIVLHVLGTLFAVVGLFIQLLQPDLIAGSPVIYGVILLVFLLIAIVRRVGWWEPPYQSLPP